MFLIFIVNKWGTKSTAETVETRITRVKKPTPQRKRTQMAFSIIYSRRTPQEVQAALV
jgi:hypothetical protein